MIFKTQTNRDILISLFIYFCIFAFFYFRVFPSDFPPQVMVWVCKVKHMDILALNMYVLWHIQLRARQTGLSVWVKPDNSNSELFSYNHIKYKNFQLIFDHKYVCMLKKKYIFTTFFIKDSITFNIAKTFTFCSQY